MVQTLLHHSFIVSFAYLQIVTLKKLFDILEKSKKLLDESLFFIDHIIFIHQILVV